MSEINPEHNADINETSKQPAEKAPLRLSQHEVFTKAAEIHKLFAGDRVRQKVLYEYRHDKEEFVESLNRDALAAGLVGKRATIEGHELIIPHGTMDLATNITTVAPANQDQRTDKSLETTMNPLAYNDKFKGFSIFFDKIPEHEKYEDEEGEDIFRPYLSLLVDAGTFTSHNTRFNLYASGNIETTTIEFDVDVKTDEIKGLNDSLKWLVPAANESIDRMNVALSKTELDDTVLRYAANHANKITALIDEDVLRVVVEDLVSDLVYCYLEKSASYELRSPVYLKSQDKTKLDEKLLHTSPSTMYRFVRPIKGVSFMDEFDFTQNGVESQGTRALHLIIGDVEGEKYYYIPFKHIATFKKA